VRLVFAILASLLIAAACGGPQVRQQPDYSDTYRNSASEGRNLDREPSPNE
jgi:hypothetical protein